MQEVSAGATDTAEHVQNQLEQTHAIQDKVDEVATAVEEIGNSMTLTLKALAEGKQDIEHLASEVEASVDNGTEVTEKLENLNQYMDEMNSIVELIGGITNQTSLLALNASIEAARAGEAGRGFSVVATEISGMATRTKEATVHITELISNVSNAIMEVVGVVSNMIDGINEEKTGASNAEESFESIEDSTRAIQKNADTLSRSISELQTKDELNKTWLTNATVGYGNNQKKDFEGQVNYFSKDGDNLSFIAQSTNRYQNSTYKDNINNSVGMNMTHKFGKKFSLTGSVNYNLNRNGNLSSIYQEQYLPAGNQYSASTNESNSKGRSISSNFMGSWEVDKRTRIHFTGNLGISPNRNENSSQNASFDAPPGISHESLFDDFESIPRDIKVNRSENRSRSENQSNRYSWMMGIMRRLNEKGTTLALNILNSDSWGDNESFSLSKTTYFRLEDKLGNDSVLFRNQYLKSPQKNNSWRVGITFAQPIGKKMHFRVAYNWDTNYERDNRDTYELSSLTKSEVFGELPPDYEAGYVDSLSNRSHSRTNGHNLDVGLNYSDDTWMFNASLGMTPQKRAIERKMGKLYADTTMHTIDFQPMIWVNWKKKEARITFNYSGRTRQPSLSDLMPLTDNSNPLYITRGNPDLKQMFSHSVRVSFQHSKKGISANIGGQMEQNSVTQVVLYDAKTGGRETSPININGNWNVYGSANWWKRLGHFSLRLDMNGNHSNRVSMINEDKSLEPKKSTTRDTGLGCDANVSYQPTWGGIDFSTSWNYQYSLNSINDNDTYTRNYSFRLEGYVDLPFGLQLRTDGAYSFRNGTNIRKGEDDQMLWNASASWRFLKKKEAELSAYWADILGKRKSFGRTTSSDGFYEFRNQEIKGYFIVTFKYNFRLMM